MRRLTILLLEDEPIIALDLSTELEEMGHYVIAALDAKTALLLCDCRLPDVVILNFMPSHTLDGMSLAKILRVKYMVKVLLVTGARWHDMETSIDFYAGIEVIYKPFTRRQLLDSLAVLLS